MSNHHPRIAVLVPCFNEAATVADVVSAFSRTLPTATIYVYDNNSTDETAAAARAAGAIVRSETRQGKGFVVSRMFSDIEADIYVMIDGDNTYDASAAPKLVDYMVEHRLDFVNGLRQSEAEDAYRKGHRFGNWALSRLVQAFFGRQFDDMLSGYKVLSRRFVKTFPAISRGFETETELAIHSLRLRMPCAELPTQYRERPAGSESKLNTYRDGFRILMFIAQLVKDERPLMFFGMTGILLMTIGFLLGIPVVIDYAEIGLVPRLPTAILSVGVVIIGVLSLFMGLLLDMMTRSRVEAKRLAYLAIPAFATPPNSKSEQKAA
ncbi:MULTISPECIES: glycosyltransferase family 2 protein [Rhodopseudomonas]|uniref:Glycosyl transferase family protein n=1 Tax=Rhodopseudomonas palustris TaxID=1076 RepID=A0A0D7F5N9_RHOPL|nr:MULTISPECIES: glycosyltransferase family 2 protein [Rhodopseudomonas]KIZ47027.1 glycosyl transferase family protein [Rhodopseudomonas palustris]MDF3813992.1 glycosyltransferase family 2 protein [Rhodopseudomonas sp. BAL398]WOK19952.1 glycosyltransferase family 2 protein [Rhodopseudomonas sp. BAL398]